MSHVLTKWTVNPLTLFLFKLSVIRGARMDLGGVYLRGLGRREVMQLHEPVSM